MTLGEVGNEMARISEKEKVDTVIEKSIKLHVAAFQNFIKDTRVAQNPFIIATMRVLLAGLEANTDEAGMEIAKIIEGSIAVFGLVAERSDDA